MSKTLHMNREFAGSADSHNGERHERVCIQWPTFGPYHAARLSAAARAGEQHGIEVLGLETAGHDKTYRFALTNDLQAERITVYPDQAFEELTPTRMSEGVRTALDKLNPSAVAITSYSFPDARASLRWCKDNRRIAILMSSTKEDDAPRKLLRERIKRIIVTGFDAAIVGGTPQKTYLSSLGFPETAIYRGYNVVDGTHFGSGADEARSNPNRFTHLPGLSDPTPFFLASGRMIPRKNYRRLLRAYKSYQERVPNPWRLVIAGDGPERSDLTAFIRSNAIVGVTLAGFRSYDEMPAYYGLAAALVHPALTDQWALVVNEAMAASLPVIVSNGCGCTTDLVRPDQNGFVFEPKNEQELSGLLERLSSDPAGLQRMGAASREIISHWGADRFGSALIRAIDYAKTTERRPASPALAATLALLRRMTSSLDSFHTVEA